MSSSGNQQNFSSTAGPFAQPEINKLPTELSAHERNKVAELLHVLQGASSFGDLSKVKDHYLQLLQAERELASSFKAEFTERTRSLNWKEGKPQKKTAALDESPLVKLITKVNKSGSEEQKKLADQAKVQISSLLESESLLHQLKQKKQMETINIYPENCADVQKEAITLLLQTVSSNEKVTSQENYAKACQQYVELMKLEKRLKMEHPKEYESLQSGKAKVELPPETGDPLITLINNAKQQGISTAEVCYGEYSILRAAKALMTRLSREVKMDTHPPPGNTGNRQGPQQGHVHASLGAQQNYTNPHKPTSGNKRTDPVPVPQHSSGSMAMAPIEGRKGKESKPNKAMGELPMPGDRDETINWKRAYEDLYRSWEFQQSQIDELTSRLSSFASKQLTDGNPNFTDLSDKNRPTKIGEKFGLVYDDEWSEAFEEVKVTRKDEMAVIELLLNVVKEAFKFCENVASSQLQHLKDQMLLPVLYPFAGQQTAKKNLPPDVQKIMEAATNKHAKEYRKLTALASAHDVCQKFLIDPGLRSLLSNDIANPKVRQYIEKTTEQLWLMVVQDPPMHIACADKGTQVNKELFRFYEKKGKKVFMTVWPVVYLHKGGPVVSKGYVMPE